MAYVLADFFKVIIFPQIKGAMASYQEDLSMDGAIRPGQDKNAYDCDVDVKVAKAASEAAFIRVMEFEANSKLMHRPEEGQDVARLEWDDICVEGLLGVGGFACVSKVSVPVLEADDDPADEGSDRKSATSGTSCSSANYGVYALKCLNERTTMDPNTFTTGAADLASEFLILSNLSHDNIVRVYGVSSGCVSEAFEESGGYFILLELLRGTVSDLLRLWRDDLKESAKSSRIPSPFDRIQEIALGISRGMEYLHQSNIVLRDLKPHNVGFDRAGNPRIFDFGLAREVVIDSTTTSVAVPGVAGSWRYMAPEVALGDGSVFASDVYSFGAVLWELLTLEKPFDKMSGPEEHRQKVATKGARPSTTNIPTSSLKDLLKDCWETNPELRPVFTDVCKSLEMELNANKEELEAKQRLSWRQQFSILKKSAKTQIRERRRSNGM